MIGYIGLFTLIVVAVTSSFASISGVASYRLPLQHRLHLDKVVQLLTLLSMLFAVAAIVVLAVAFAVDDYSIKYVSDNSNSQLHLGYKIAATWGGHQGSMLFWVVTLSLWGAALSFVQDSVRRHAMWLMQLIVAIFAWFTLLASNPFELNAVIPTQGRDLNPMLQDIGLIIHPPLLYVGYVGFASVLALALGSLFTSSLGTSASSTQWVVSARVCAVVAWLFLTAGIAVGSWWAYYELGWGGWWFWDPVENASLLPWLTSCALIHTMMLAKHRQLVFWTYSLAFITFCLSILGTFIVRSGVLTSVHAFAVDPTKGFSLLAILTIIFVLAFVSLILCSDSLHSKAITDIRTKPFLILIAVNLFTLATMVVVFGTFYPMVYELLGLGNISVGAPYFNLLFGPLSIFALFVMGFVPFCRWKSDEKRVLTPLMAVLFFASLIAAFAVVLYYSQHNAHVGAEWSFWAFMTVWGSVWVMLSHLRLLHSHKMNRGLYAVILAHVGIAVAAFGSAMNAEYSYEMTRKLGPGSSVEFGDFNVRYLDTHLYVARSFSSEQAEIEITPLSNPSKIQRAYPEKRHYPVRVMNMTEPSMTPKWDGDIYISLGDKVDAEHYAVRIQFKAFVRWIWFGALLVCLSGVWMLLSQLFSIKRVQCENSVGDTNVV
ncbi:heme lyase CcmF/NrfE family subunit [Vibrio mediterranei]